MGVREQHWSAGPHWWSNQQPSMCPWPETNQHPLGAWDHAQPTEPLRPGWSIPTLSLWKGPFQNCLWRFLSNVLSWEALLHLAVPFHMSRDSVVSEFIHLCFTWSLMDSGMLAYNWLLRNWLKLLFFCLNTCYFLIPSASLFQIYQKTIWLNQYKWWIVL